MDLDLNLPTTGRHAQIVHFSSSGSMDEAGWLKVCHGFVGDVGKADWEPSAVLPFNTARRDRPVLVRYI